MEFEPVESSNLAAVGYEARTATLGVRFKDGAEYHYERVPRRVYDELLAAPSKGKHFDEHVKKAGYAYRRVTPGRRGPART